VCDGLILVLVPPSPKLQLLDVIEPEEASVKLTANGAVPLVGEPEKLATGGGVGEVAVIKFDFVSVSLPPGPVTVRLTVYVPAEE